MGLCQFCQRLLSVLLLVGLLGSDSGASIRLDAAADVLTRTTGFPAFGSHTRMMWVYRVVDQTFNEILFYICNSSAFNQYFGGYLQGIDALAVTEATLTASQSGTVGAVFVPLATWTHIAFVFNDAADTYQMYVNGVLDTGSALATVTGTATWGYEAIGNTASGNSEWLNGRFSSYKMFNAVLTQAEIQAEMRYFVPVRRANVQTYSPLRTATELTAYVGGATWTASGTLTTEADPPLKGGVGPGNGFLAW
jgi:hypothetical protein